MRKMYLYAVSLRYTRLRQIIYRLRFVIERQLARSGWLATALYRRCHYAAKRNQTAAAVQQPFNPLFAPRKNEITWEDGKPQLLFLNRKLPLQQPMVWHPPKWGTDAGLEVFHLHYMTWLEGLDDEWFTRTVSDWIHANPPDQRQARNRSWSSYVISLRCVVWMQQYARRQSRLPEPFLRDMICSLAGQLYFLENHLEHDIGGNHLIKNIKALLWAGQFLRGADACRWSAIGRHLLSRELHEQILPDGMHFERSPAYHVQVFADLLECYAISKDGPFRKRLADTLHKMATVTKALTHPDKKISLFNDGGLRMAYSPGECLKVYQTLLGRNVATSDAVWLTEAGYYGRRQGNDYLLMDCGPIGPDHLPAHGHGDTLSFEWDVAGERIVVDAGVYEYHAGRWRELSRASRCHNTVTLDEQDQSEFWKSFRVGRRARAKVHCCKIHDETMMFVGSHDGYARLAGSPRHIRRLSFKNAGIHVTDTITCGAGQVAKAHLLLHPACRPRWEKKNVVISRGSVQIRLSASGSINIDNAWWFPDFGVKQPTHRITITYRSAPCRGHFILSRL